MPAPKALLPPLLSGCFRVPCRMRLWLILLGGMIVWAVHFFALYALASIFASTIAMRAGVVLVTTACVAADGALLLASAGMIRGGRSDDVARWTGSLGAFMAGLSLLAVVWQGLPALLG